MSLKSGKRVRVVDTVSRIVDPLIRLFESNGSKQSMGWKDGREKDPLLLFSQHGTRVNQKVSYRRPVLVIVTAARKKAHAHRKP